MKIITRSDRLIFISFAVGVLQYASVVFQASNSNDPVLWQLDTASMESAGPFRYLKDAWVLFLALTWPLVAYKISCTRNAKFNLSTYFVWLVMVCVVGSIGFLLGYSDLIFLQAGLRWMMLLHATVGLFYLSRFLPGGSSREVVLARALLILALLDIAFAVKQLAAAGSVYGIGLGAARVTGLFNNAGVAGFFGLAIALVSMQFDSVSFRTRFLLTFLAFFIALSSGSRSTMIAVFTIFALQAWEYGDIKSAKTYRALRRIFFFPALIGVVTIGYAVMIAAVDRGGILEMQLGSGGRIDTARRMIDLLRSAEAGELLFGRGLGVGTNTAYTLLVSTGFNPESIRFNWLVDNAILTVFLQMGTIGSVIFWGGVLVGVLVGRPKGLLRFQRRYWLAVLMFVFFIFTGNPFEHYLIMMPTGIAMGAAFWLARYHRMMDSIELSPGAADLSALRRPG